MMPFAIIGVFLLMSIVDGRTLVHDRSTTQWMVYLAVTLTSSGVLLLYSLTFSKPNILLYLEVWLRPISRWFAG